MLGGEPKRKLGLRLRQYFAAYTISLGKPFETFADGRDPIRSGFYIVVREGEDRCARRGYASIARVRNTLLRFEVPGQVLVLRAQLFKRAASLVGGIVIHDDHFIARAPAVLVHQALDSSAHHVGAVVSGYDYGYVRSFRRAVHHYKRTTISRKLQPGELTQRLTAPRRVEACGGKRTACRTCRADGDRNRCAPRDNAGASRCRCQTEQDDF